MSSSSKPTLYLSFDIEADGKSPAVSSMLSFGLVIFNAEGKEIDKLQMNLYPSENRTPEERCTKEFWDKNPHIKEFVEQNRQPQGALPRALKELWEKYSSHYKLKWIANPAAYDWQWVNCIYDEFRDPSWPDIGYSAKCIGTLFSVYSRLKKISAAEEDAKEEAMMKALQEPGHVAHNPEHDARVQGKLFFVLCKELGIEL